MSEARDRLKYWAEHEAEFNAETGRSTGDAPNPYDVMTVLDELERAERESADKGEHHGN